MNIVWSVRHMEVKDSVDGHSKVVDLVRWTLTASNETQSSSLDGFEHIDFASSSFTPFEKLVEADVISWCHAAMGEYRRSELEKYVVQMVEQTSPPVASVPKVELPLPWAPIVASEA